MRSGQDRLWWTAVSALREAETLAELAGKVSGPADEPPKAGDEKSWVEDWAARSRAVLKKFLDHASTGPSGAVPLAAKRAAQQVAKRAAGHIREGARSINRATRGQTANVLKPVTDLANAITIATGIGSVLATAALLFVGWKLLESKGT
jgi:hypothetical protein